MDEPADRGGAPHRSGSRDLRRHAGRGAGAGRRGGAGRRHRLQRGVPRIHRRARPLDRGPRLLRNRFSRRGHGRRTEPRLDLDLRAMGQPGAPRRARDPGRRRRPAASRRRLSRPELRRRLLRRLVRRSRARPGRRPPPRPGIEDPPGRRLGRDHQLGARRPDGDHRPGRRGRLAGVGPRHEHRGAGAGPRRVRGGASARPGRTRSTTGSSTPSRSPTSSWPAWSRWTSPR